MEALCASYPVAQEQHLQFNEPEAVALEFSTHADFAEARADSVLCDATTSDVIWGELSPKDLSAVEDGVRKLHGL